MAVFAIIPTPTAALPPKLATAVLEHYKDANFAIAGGHGWLVSANRTAKELSDQLGITDGSNGSAIVLEVASYFGRADPNVWSWIKLHWDSGSGG